MLTVAAQGRSVRTPLPSPANISSSQPVAEEDPANHALMPEHSVMGATMRLLHAAILSLCTSCQPCPACFTSRACRDLCHQACTYLWLRTASLVLGSLVGAVVFCARFSILIACLCRAVVVVGDEQGHVGVGCASAKEVIQAVSKAVADGKRSLVTVPLTAGATFPHRVDAYFGAAKVTP